MTVLEEVAGVAPARAPAKPAAASAPRDLQCTFQLVLATVWLVDAALQLQPFMFTPGPNGFSGMLTGLAPGNPGWTAHTITWNSSIVYHQPILTNAIFAGIQFVIGFGIARRRTLKPALVLSIVWSLGVWLFGEGLGGVLAGTGTPIGGGPGGVLFYALLAVLLWPAEGSGAPFVAARNLGVEAAKATWAVVWIVLAVLSVVGSGRSPGALSGLVTGMEGGQPGWLIHIDRWAAAVLLHDGTGVAIAFGALCVLMAACVYLPAPMTQFLLVVGIVTFAAIWVAVQNFGGILAGGATDPNSGPLVILFILIYWPLTERLARSGADVAVPRSGPSLAEA